MTAARKPITGRKFVTFSQGKIAARKFAREQARLRNSLSRGFQKKLLTVFNRTIKKATESLNNQQIPEIGVISQSFKEELTATVKTQVRRVYSTIYEANYKRYQEVSQKAEGDPFDFRRSQDFEVAVASYFFNRQNMMVGITDTTARQILDRIEKLRGEDNTLDQIARQLPKEFAQVNRRRANVIARTETHSAAGYANHDYYSQASDSYGIQMVKQWVATSDARTRQQHSLMNGTKVPMDEDFIMPNGARMGFTGDSKGGAVHVINCRCVTLYHEPEDEVVESKPISAKVEGKELSFEEIMDGLDDSIFEDVSVGMYTRSRGQDTLNQLAKLQGFDGLPKKVSPSQFNTLGGTTYYRGVQDVGDVTRAEVKRRSLDGDYFAGQGIFGNGLYSAYGENGRDFGLGYTATRNGRPAGEDGLITFKLADNAKIMDHKDAMKQSGLEDVDKSKAWFGARDKYNDRFMAKINDITEKIESGQIAKDVGEKQINIFRSRIRFAYELAEDPTAYAMARGFDAVRVVLNEYQRERLGGEGVDFLIYLNRTAMIAQDD